MSQEVIIFLSMAIGSIIVVTFSNHLDGNRKKFFSKSYKLELFICLIPLLCIGIAIYRICVIFMYYCEDWGYD